LTAGDFSGMVDFNPGTATFNMTSNGYKDIFIQKLDLNGNFIFAKQIGGNISNDAAWSIKTDVFGNIITTGWFYGTVDFDPGKHTFNLISQFGDSYIEKLDGNGNFVWARGMTGSFNGIYSVTTDAGGNIYSTGFFNGTVDFNPSPASHSLTSHGSSDIYIHKLDVNGNFQWVEQLGGDSIDCGLGIVADAGGNLYATGFFSKNADFDPGFGTVSLISNGCVDMYIQKLGQTECTDIYEPNETQATAKTIAVNTDIRAMIGIATDIDWFKFSNTNKNKNIRITLANLPANYDVALFNAAGTQLGISQNTGNADEMITYNTSAVGTYYVKVYGSSGAYDPIACYKLKASIQQSSWKSLETAINDGEPATDLSVYPNPCKNLLNIEFNASSADKPSVKLTDMSGKIVRTCTFNAAAGKNIYTIDLSESGNGLYFLVLTTTDQSYFRKIIINR
jgi:hypothetical protein